MIKFKSNFARLPSTSLDFARDRPLGTDRSGQTAPFDCAPRLSVRDRQGRRDGQRRQLLLLLLIFFLAPLFTFGQLKTVTGMITSDGEPLIGASVSIEGTAAGTVTDLEGEYSLSGVPEGATLVLSFVGMITQEIPVLNQTEINVSMALDILGLEEIVVTGYGSVRRSDLTGAVSSVKPNELTKTASISIGHMLQGRAAGLEIKQNSAQPGGGLDIRIRGAASIRASNEPLIVLDGFPLAKYVEPEGSRGLSATWFQRFSGGSKESNLSLINPNDIESIEVLKDASATAIYGARAANGVILITTKRGEAGKVQVNYNGSYSIQKDFNRRPLFTDSKEYMNVVNEIFQEHYLWENQLAPFGSTDPSTVPGFVPLHSSSDISGAGKGTDWQDEIFQTGTVSQHNLSISGGASNTKYLFSLNYFDHNGIVLGRGIKRITSRMNVDTKLNDFLTLGISSTFSQKRDDNNQIGGAGASTGVLQSLRQAIPIVPVFDENGNYSLTHPLIPNPVSYREIDDNSVTDRLLFNPYITVSPIKDLKLRMSVGADIWRAKRSYYIPTSVTFGAQVGGEASVVQNQRDNYLFDITANYSKTFKDIHRFTALAGYAYEEFNFEGIRGSNIRFLTDGFSYYDLGGGGAERPDLDSFGGKDLIASYFGRINYSLSDRYLLTATMRADGASNFAQNNKWGYFPSVALGWRLSEESFMAGSKIISHLKLRTSYGQTGNSGIGHVGFAAYRTGINFLFGGGELVGVSTLQLENPDLKWETTTEVNVGLDFGFINNRISGSFEYFNKTISDLLATKFLSSYHEVNRVAANIGETQSKGLELRLAGVIVDKRDFSWRSVFNFSSYEDRWKSRDPDWKPAIYESVNDHIRPIFNYLADGLIQLGEAVPHMPGAPPGAVNLKDVDGFARDGNGNPVTDENGRFLYSGGPDGRIDEADLVNLGSVDPGYSMSLNNTFNYKNFDLNIYAYGYFNQYLHQPYIHEVGGWSTDPMRNRSNGNPGMKDRWTLDNQDSNIPGTLQRYSGYGKVFFGTGDLEYKDTWFIRLSNITLGYSIPNKILGEYISNAHFYVEVQNLHLFTNFEGRDPENIFWYGESRPPFNVPDRYPTHRTFSMGVNLTF